MDYKNTIRTPKTDFPMKADLPKREPELLAFWDGIDLYNTVQKSREGRDKFVLHDGPPYANSDIHCGTAMNKILKDFVVKHATMQGYDSAYVPGYDTHGLPIELRALKEAGLDWHNLDPVVLREKCAEYAYHYSKIQTEQFVRLGVRGDWDHPYMTLKPEYEATEVQIFAAFATGGHLYRGLKPVYWCATDETALAEGEIEYHDKTSDSIYVAFPVRDGKGKLPADAFVAIWTTTPWTLPANLGIALHPDVEYGLYETERGKLLLAVVLAEKVLGNLGLTGKQLATFVGKDLEGVVCKHPFIDRDSLVILGDHVTTEDGTGCVHTAPGHGHEDFEVGKAYGLPVLNPVNDRGIFTEEAGEFAGMYYEKANPAIIEKLGEVGALLKADKIRHSYAHCWRCKKPVLYRATTQWFAKVSGFMDDALRNVDTVQWIPARGINRIKAMVEGLSDWCISRQRSWGVPIPVLTCTACNHDVMEQAVFDQVSDIFRQEGSNAWWKRPASDFAPEGFKCPACGGTEFRKEKDIMDVWFDSGSSHLAVAANRPELQWPVDVYLEGSDQHRGWFKSSLLTSTVAKGRAPYRSVVTHGMVVDENGRKMSKSLGNVVNPLDVIKQYGADILRLWVASVDYQVDVSMSPNILKQVAETYRKIRNTFRFLLGNLADFDPATDQVQDAAFSEMDRYILHRLQEVTAAVRKGYTEYEYLVVHKQIYDFMALDLSSFYLDVLKDRLYCDRPDAPERRAAQTVLYRCLDALVRLLAPVLTFTTEEVYQHMPQVDGRPVSVQLLELPEVDPHYLDDQLAQRWQRLLAVREAVQGTLEQARAAKAIGSSSQAQVHLYTSNHPDESLNDLLREMLPVLPEVFIVSQVLLFAGGQEAPAGAFFGEGPDGLKVAVALATGAKCERCWNYRELGVVPEHPTLCERCAAVVLESNL